MSDSREKITSPCYGDCAPLPAIALTFKIGAAGRQRLGGFMVTMYFAFLGLWVVCVVLVRGGCSMTQHTQANYPDFCKESLYINVFGRISDS